MTDDKLSAEPIKSLQRPTTRLACVTLAWPAMWHWGTCPLHLQVTTIYSFQCTLT